MTRRIIFLSLLVVLLPGCAATTAGRQYAHEAAPQFSAPGAFGKRPALITETQLFQLTTAQKKALHDFVDQPRLASSALNHRLYLFLQQLTEGFNYQGDTLTATQAFDRRAGNCMTLAILTTALGRELGLKLGYTLLDDVPVYELNGDTVLKGVHVRTLVYKPERENDGGHSVSASTSSAIAIDYFPTGRERYIANISGAEFLARYYQNIAADALSAGDLDSAYWNAMEALHHDPDSADALNMLAVVNSKAGDEAHAEAIYLYGLDTARDKLSLLKNYQVLLQQQGREREAGQIDRLLADMDDPSPFHWFHLAQLAAGNGDYPGAIRYYKKALRLAPYLHEAYLGMAQADARAGNLSRAAKALNDAIDNTYKASTRRLYQAKLDVLTKAMEASR